MESERRRDLAEYEQGREDERRFERDRITDDVRDSERTPLASAAGFSGAAGPGSAAPAAAPAAPPPPRR